MSFHAELLKQAHFPRPQGAQETDPGQPSPLDLADQAEQAFLDWRQVRGSLPADTFLTGLLAYRHIRG